MINLTTYQFNLEKPVQVQTDRQLQIFTSNVTPTCSPKPENRNILHHFGYLLLGIFLLLSVFPIRSFAQVSSDARAMVMGGGTAYVTGFEANFYNPANLLIPDYKYTTEIELGSASLQLNRRPVNQVFVPYQGLLNQFLPNRTGNFLDINGNRQKLLDHWFDGEDANYSRYATFSTTPVGISWQNGPFAYSVGVHSRGFNRFELSKGWYTGNTQNITNQNQVTRDLKQTIVTYQEISVGFAQEVTLIDGWSPQLNRLYVGVAPKFIIPGMYMQADYQSAYQRNTAGDLQQIRALNMMSAGAISGTWDGTNGDLTNGDLFSPTGWGLGLDMGITYVKSLGNDIALLRGETRTPLRKSIRISISLTDIGFVRYNHHVTTINKSKETRLVQQLPDGPTTEFTGSPVQYLSYLQADGAATGYTNAGRVHDISVSLPTAFHAGAAYQDNWWMLTGDLTYSMNKNSFNFGGWMAHAGAEIRLLHFLPLRGGLQWQPGHHLILAAGLGVDTKRVSIDFGTRFSAPSTNRGFYLIGAAVTTLRLHI